VALVVLKIEINPMWILCDNYSSVDIFKNKDMIINIQKSENPIRLKIIEGNTIVVDQKGDLLGYKRKKEEAEIAHTMIIKPLKI